MQFVASIKPTASGFEIRLPDIQGFCGRAVTVLEAKSIGHKYIYEAAAKLARLGKPMWTPQGFDPPDSAVEEAQTYWAVLEVTIEHLFGMRVGTEVNVPDTAREPSLAQLKAAKSGG